MLNADGIIVIVVIKFSEIECDFSNQSSKPKSLRLSSSGFDALRIFSLRSIV
jgi:hypothetical protein